MLKPKACIFAIKRSWGVQSKAFERNCKYWNFKYLLGLILKLADCLFIARLLCGMVFVFLMMRRHVCIFLLTWILVKTMSRKFRRLCKSFWRFDKRFYNNSKNMFANTSKGNWFFIFLMLPKHIIKRYLALTRLCTYIELYYAELERDTHKLKHIHVHGLKNSRNIKRKYLFYF